MNNIVILCDTLRRDHVSAYTDGKWKLILKHKNGKSVYPSDALYDMNADLSESRNLSDTYPEVVDRLRQQLAAEITR